MIVVLERRLFPSVGDASPLNETLLAVARAPFVFLPEPPARVCGCPALFMLLLPMGGVPSFLVFQFDQCRIVDTYSVSIF